MQATLTVRISSAEAQSLENLCASTGKSRSEVVRDALRGYRLRESLKASQTQLAPIARAMGLMSEEDLLDKLA
jgi:predicted transcriptional regulator